MRQHLQYDIQWNSSKRMVQKSPNMKVLEREATNISEAMLGALDNYKKLAILKDPQVQQARSII